MSTTRNGEDGLATLRRDWRWRWLVTVTDLPPMPRNVEVWYGFLTRRRAVEEADRLRSEFASASHRTYRLAAVGVRRRGRL